MSYYSVIKHSLNNELSFYLMKFCKRILVALTLVLSSLTAGAQIELGGQDIDIDYLTPKQYEIAAIDIEGSDNLDNRMVLLVSGLHVGDRVRVPGDKVSSTTTIQGKRWYAKQYVIHGDDDFVNFVFSTGTGSPQTVDINNVTTDKFFEISAEKDGTKHKVNDVTSSYTAIELTTVEPASTTLVKVYTIDGHLLRVLPAGTTVNEALNQLGHGLYLINGRKYVK